MSDGQNDMRMLVGVLFLLALLVIQSFYSIRFIKKYISLNKTGIKSSGKVVSYVSFTFVMIKNSLIPKILFLKRDGDIVTEKPIHSWFVELNGFELGKSYVVYYDEKNPKSFVVKSNAEIVANSLVILITIFVIMWAAITYT